MRSARIRFAADILRRLGEELNPSLAEGVVELVKNSHDADASSCVVRLTNVTEPGGSLTVVDDGDGMTADELERHFLLLGRSEKKRGGTTESGRILAGSKGLGRLAALRAGRHVLLQSVSSVEPEVRNSLRIDWTDYDRVDSVDAVELVIESIPAVGERQGTSVEVAGLTRRVGRREVRRLARSLLLLADPFDDSEEAFRPRLESPEFEDLEELVRRKYFDDAEYFLRAKVNDRGEADAVVSDWRGEPLFRAGHSDLERTGENYTCPPAEFEFWVFILDGQTFQTRASSLGEVRRWLAEFGGVMLYRNGLRVQPYGDEGHDWLDINLSRTRSPEERPGTNTSLGRVRVDDRAGVLTAKTDRSGLIESPEFLDLARFAKDALDWLARERIKVAEARRRQERSEARDKSQDASEDVRAAIDTAGDTAPAIKKAFDKYERARDRETRSLRDEVQLYRTLSTAGITSATFAHESSGGPLKVIGRAISALKRRLRKTLGDLPLELTEPLEAIASNTQSLAAFGDTTLDLVDRDKRRAGRVDVHAVIEGLAATYRPFVEGRSARLELRLQEAKPYLRGSIAAVESIVVNLLTNALSAIAQSAGADRWIRVSTVVADGRVSIVVEDSGPGLVAFSPSEIWLPGVTSRPGGSGLGLTIVRDTATDLGGTAGVDPVAEGAGAKFTVSLPIIGAD